MSSKKPNIIARSGEAKILARAQSSSQAEFLALYGRRRIGKTFLVHEYFKNSSFFFEFTGTKDLAAQAQIKNFTHALEKAFKIKLRQQPLSWQEALALLAKQIEKWPKKYKTKKIIFFDELPWLASQKSGFLEALDYFWNATLSKRKDGVLIVCGSAANWMIAEVVNDKGGLHNRITRPPLAMSPFTLKETHEYLQARGMRLTFESVAEIYMTTGGVAYYLNQINKGESATQFINNNFFAPHGELRTEFDRLFRSLFDRHETHVEIVRALAQHPSGLTYQELHKKLKIKAGGTFTKILTELEKSSFIHSVPKMGNIKRESVFRLVDEYTLFYLTWIESLGRTFKDKHYWQKQIGKPRHYRWLGHAFESLCLKHSEEIKRALGISGLTTHVYGFRNKKAQIDMIIDRSDKTMNLCEMKYSQSPFILSAAEAQKIKNRKTELLLNLDRKKQIFTTLVTALPAEKNKHYLEVVDHEINLESFFG